MNVTNYVEKALIEFPDTRNSDKKLCLTVWWMQDKDYDDNFKSFFIDRALSPESVTRCRRKFQEEGKYLADEKVDKARYDKYKLAKNANLVDSSEMHKLL